MLIAGYVLPKRIPSLTEHSKRYRYSKSVSSSAFAGLEVGEAASPIHVGAVLPAYVRHSGLQENAK